PISVEAEGPAVNAESAPLGLTVRYKFPKTENHGALNFTWYDSKMIPKKINGVRVRPNGVMFVGTEGMMFADYGSYKLYPDEDFKDFSPPEKSIPASIGHHREWLKACREGSSTTCNFDYSGALTETVLLGNIAYRSETKFDWNAEKLQASNEKAQSLVSKEYREGWEVEA
ncbi:MAG: gfo/Idh/MocA family oxidoreductase, partial [Planctomycetota bacterium]